MAGEAAPSSADAVLGPVSAPPPSAGELEAAARLIFVVNEERAKNGLPPFKMNPQLMAAAHGHSWDMAFRDFFSHTGSDGKSVFDRISAQGYSFSDASENISAGRMNAETTVRGWMTSSGHKATLLSTSFTEAGGGFVYQMDDMPNVLYNGSLGGPYYFYWTLDVASRSGNYPVIINNEAPTTDTLNVNLAIYGKGWAQQMMISESSDFSGATWEPYASTKPWQLTPRTGTHTVYVRLRHSSGQTKDAFDDIMAVGAQAAPAVRVFLPLTPRLR